MMRLKNFHSPLLNVAALAGMLGTVGCSNAANDDIGHAQEPIINGNTVSTDNIGSPYLTMTNPSLTGHCTGTMIRSDWVLTAHHCVTENADRFGGTAIQPSEITAHILNGGNTPSGRLIVRHPTLDVALVKMTAAPTGPSLVTYPNWFSLASDAGFVGQSFFSQGWGANAITSCSATPGSTGAGVLRWANLPVSWTEGDDQFETSPNSSGQIGFLGDSGSSLYYQVRSYYRPIGVASYVGCSNNPPTVSDSHYVRADAFRGWAQGVAGFAPSQGQSIGYDRSDGVTAFNYIEPNSGHVKEISTNGGGSYSLGDLTWLSGGPAAAAGSQIASYVRTDGTNAVAFEGTDGDIYELELVGFNWYASNLTAILGLPTALGSPTAYVRSDNTSAIVYVGSDQHVYEMRLPSGGTWLATDLSSATGFPAAPIDVATGYVRSDGLDVVVYTASNGDIIELSRDGTQWWANDLSWITGAPAAASSARPYTRADGYSIVLYRTTSDHIYELSLYSGGPSWGLGDLTWAGGCPNTASEPSPYVRIDGTNAVLFRGADQHVYEIRLAPGSNWACKDLTNTTGAPVASTTPGGFVGADRLNYVVFKDGNGHMWNFASSVTASNNWSKLDMTAVAGGP